MKTMMILMCLLAAAGCVTGDSEAEKTLTSSGYSDVKLTGLDFFECSDKDKTGKGFTAKNPVGVEVKGVVCCGVLKGCTVRF